MTRVYVRSRAQVQGLLQPQVSMHSDSSKKYKLLSAGQPIFAGIDWGTGENSYTVMTLCDCYVDMQVPLSST
jgi:hypothetical protein